MAEKGPDAHMLTYDEAVTIGADMGWLTTPSWLAGGHYVTTQPSRRLLPLLEPYRMAPGIWGRRFYGSPIL